MIRRKPTYFRNSLDLRDKVQVKVLRRRLKVSDEQFADIFRKSGNSISAITKEAERAAIASRGPTVPRCPSWIVANRPLERQGQIMPDA